MRNTCGINKYKTGSSSACEPRATNTEFDKKLAEMQQKRAAVDSMWNTVAAPAAALRYTLYEGSQDPKCTLHLNVPFKCNLYEGSQDPKYTSPNVTHPSQQPPASLGKGQYAPFSK